MGTNGTIIPGRGWDVVEAELLVPSLTWGSSASQCSAQACSTSSRTPAILRALGGPSSITDPPDAPRVSLVSHPPGSLGRWRKSTAT